MTNQLWQILEIIPGKYFVFKVLNLIFWKMEPDGVKRIRAKSWKPNLIWSKHKHFDKRDCKEVIYLYKKNRKKRLNSICIFFGWLYYRMSRNKSNLEEIYKMCVVFVTHLSKNNRQVERELLGFLCFLYRPTNHEGTKAFGAKWVCMWMSELSRCLGLRLQCASLS